MARYRLYSERRKEKKTGLNLARAPAVSPHLHGTHRRTVSTTSTRYTHLLHACFLQLRAELGVRVSRDLETKSISLHLKDSQPGTERERAWITISSRNDKTTYYNDTSTGSRGGETANSVRGSNFWCIERGLERRKTTLQHPRPHKAISAGICRARIQYG